MKETNYNSQKSLVGYLGLATKASYVFIGSMACINAVKSKKAKIVIAGNLSSSTISKIKNLCDSNDVKLFLNQQELLNIVYPSGAIKIVALKNNGLTDKITLILNKTFGGTFNS